MVTPVVKKYYYDNTASHVPFYVPLSFSNLYLSEKKTFIENKSSVANSYITTGSLMSQSFAKTFQKVSKDTFSSVLVQYNKQ